MNRLPVNHSLQLAITLLVAFSLQSIIQVCTVPGLPDVQVNLLCDLHSFCCNKHNFTLSLKTLLLMTFICLHRKTLSKVVSSF